MKKTFVIHPFLFAIFPVLFLFSHNLKELLINEIAVPIAVTTSFTFLLWLLLGFIFKDGKKAGLIVSLFLLLFFLYGHLPLKISFIATDFEIRHRYLFPICVAILTPGIYLIIKTRKNLHNFTNILNVVAVFLILISLINIAAYEIKTKRLAMPNIQHPTSSIQHPTSRLLPDIYYIIFDNYGGSTMLQKFFNFNNSEITDYLKNKGFYIASESCTNYPKTFQSLASSLNMKHLTYLTDKIGKESSDRTVVYEMLQDYEVWRFLKSRGYTFIHLGSWWGPTRKNRFADININYFHLNLSEFSAKLLETTMLYPILGKIAGIDLRSEMKERILLQFEKLSEIPCIKGPKFVFCHIIYPHSPYIFGPNGEFLLEQEVAKKSDRENYLNEIIFCNKKIKLLVDQILSKSVYPPVIVLQADEGPSSLKEFKRKAGEEGIEWAQQSEVLLKLHMKIFNAYYLSNGSASLTTDIDKNTLYPSITPVNSFRLIFNLYFGTNYELLEDKSYVFEDVEHPYKFIDVTDKVK